MTAGTWVSTTRMFDDSIQPGGTFSNTFDDTGTYDYFCSIHLSLTGTITV